MAELELPSLANKCEEEGGCGVVGFCCTEPVSARNIYDPSRQMHNRGNGKGGGIAALGFIPEQLGVSREVLDEYYMLHIAFLDMEFGRNWKGNISLRTSMLPLPINWKPLPIGLPSPTWK